MAVIGEQLRAARALARLEQGELAERAKVSLGTIKRLEAIVGPVSANVMTVDAVVRALESAGVEFTNGGQPGVRMKAPIVFEVLERAGDPCLKGYDKDKIVFVDIDRGVFPREGSQAERLNSAGAAVDKLNEIANRKYAEYRADVAIGRPVIDETDIRIE
jgi:transcriptional regulator with XRE-family HTH domain